MGDQGKHALIGPGTVIDGRFEILGAIGEGGSAEVYRAKQLNIERDVAVKVLHIPTTSRGAEAYTKRFMREAKLVAQMKHIGVVQIYDYGVYETFSPYIVMEFLDGSTVRDELDDRGAMKPSRVVALMKMTLEALVVAHSLSVVHRDLKPSNLFLTRDELDRERLVILDFGLAFDMDTTAERLTQAGHVSGTPQYLSPEYLQAQVVTPRLDVYQIGLIMTELLTGKPVVDEDSAYQCFAVHIAGDLPIPTWIRHSRVGHLITRSTHLDHEERYADAKEMLAELEKLTDDDLAELDAEQERAKSEGVLHAVDRSAQPDPDIGEVIGDDRMPAWALPAAAGAAAFVLFAVVISFILVLTAGNDEAEESAADAGVAAVVDTGQTDTETNVDADVAEKPIKPVAITVRPKQAEIVVGEKVVGKGSAELKFDDAAGQSLKVRVQARGYKTEELTVAAGDEPVTVSLKRLSKRDPGAKRKPSGRGGRGRRGKATKGNEFFFE